MVKVGGIIMLTVLIPATGFCADDVARALLLEWQAQAARPFAAEAGRAAWYAQRNGRSCTSCHNQSVHTQGRHNRTGKVIEPMAPTVNPVRYTNRRKVNKWFLRNCKWTYGRACTAQEKGDILTWLLQQ